MRIGVHSLNSSIKFPNLCSEMHCDELWPNYRGVESGGGGCLAEGLRVTLQRGENG